MSHGPRDSHFTAKKVNVERARIATLVDLDTQDCDIEQEKVTHVNVALLEPINRGKKENPLGFLDLNFSELVVPFDGFNFYADSEMYGRLAKTIGELVDNNNSHYMFVDVGGKGHFINLSKIFPIKLGHLEAMKKQAKFQQEGSFKNLLGWRLAYLYGRVGVDVYEKVEKEELTKKILRSVGESVTSYWPQKSYRLEDDQLQVIKKEILNYNGIVKRGKTNAALRTSIYDKLAEFGIVEKSGESPH